MGFFSSYPAISHGELPHVVINIHGEEKLLCEIDINRNDIPKTNHIMHDKIHDINLTIDDFCTDCISNLTVEITEV